MATALPNAKSIQPLRELRSLFESNAVCKSILPFGRSTAFNVLDYFQGTPEIVTNVNYCSPFKLKYFEAVLYGRTLYK